VISRLRLSQNLPVLTPERRQAAVAAIFGPGEELLMIRRAERPGDLWSGHMAFPGGKREPNDKSLLHTAIRETQEEIGLSLEAARFVGALSELEPVRRKGPADLWVTPLVFQVDRWEDPVIQSSEVASVHRFAFRRFLDKEGRGDFLYPWEGQQIRLPCVRLDDSFIWGLSLRMVDEMLEQLS
jgi:8-oxo-dGTP pyrophosphatase MutT (NUDIX family)